MRLRIHLCKDNSDADELIVFLKEHHVADGVSIRKILEPEIMIRDHSEKLAEPTQINFSKICVVYETE